MGVRCLAAASLTIRPIDVEPVKNISEEEVNYKDFKNKRNYHTVESLFK